MLCLCVMRFSSDAACMIRLPCSYLSCTGLEHGFTVLFKDAAERDYYLFEDEVHSAFKVSSPTHTIRLLLKALCSIEEDWLTLGGCHLV